MRLLSVTLLFENAVSQACGMHPVDMIMLYSFVTPNCRKHFHGSTGISSLPTVFPHFTPRSFSLYIFLSQFISLSLPFPRSLSLSFTSNLLPLLSLSYSLPPCPPCLLPPLYLSHSHLSISLSLSLSLSLSPLSPSPSLSSRSPSSPSRSLAGSLSLSLSHSLSLYPSLSPSLSPLSPSLSPSLSLALSHSLTLSLPPTPMSLPPYFPSSFSYSLLSLSPLSLSLLSPSMPWLIVMSPVFTQVLVTAEIMHTSLSDVLTFHQDLS